MTVYVDDMEASYQPKHRPGRTYVMCHMIADTEEELHAMAEKIGVARKWYQGDHYDIARSKRFLAILNGAKPITMRQLSCMAMLRRRGQPMGSPETAEQRNFNYHDARRRERDAASKQGGTDAGSE